MERFSSCTTRTLACSRDPTIGAMKQPVLFLKSHVKTYTRKDGSVVKEHDDKRAASSDWRDHENWHTRTMEKMKGHTDDELRFIHKDATEAADNGEKMGSKKSGQYRDEAHYASDELGRRQRFKHKPGDRVFFPHPDKPGKNALGTVKGMKDGKCTIDREGEEHVHHHDDVKAARGIPKQYTADRVRADMLRMNVAADQD